MKNKAKITITPNGPYLVKGDVPLALAVIGVNEEGESVEWKAGPGFPPKTDYHLCRCGHSNNKPYCDGSHARVGFDGTETASREPVLKQAEVMDGPAMQLADAEVLCAFARFCDPNGRIWEQTKDTDQPEVRKNFIRQAGDCPSGRLIAIDKATGKPIEPKLPESIGIVEDPARGCSGPLWVRGGVELVGSDGKSYEKRNRMTLCRCGRSENKPFCNGAHASEPGFQDGIKL